MDIKTKQTIIHCLIAGTITVPFFYLPFSSTVEAIFCLALLILLFKDLIRWLRKHLSHSSDRTSFKAYLLFLVHLSVLILLYLTAPLGGVNQMISTKQWDNAPLEQILNDISHQYGVIVQIAFDDKMILTQKVPCRTERLKLKDYVTMIQEQTGSQAFLREIIHPIFLTRSLSGYWSDLSLRILAIRDEKNETQRLTILPK